MNSKLAYSPQVKNSISVAAEENGVDLNFKKKQIIKSDEDYETILNESIQQQNTSNPNGNSTSNVDLIRNLLDPSLNFDEIIDPDEAMTLINNDKQANARHLQHSQSTDNHHLYPNAALIDGQATLQLEQLRKFNAFLISKIQYLRNENQNLVDKSKEQLSIIRTGQKSQEELSSLRSQLAIQQDEIDGLKGEAKLWKSKYEELNEKQKRLIDKQAQEQIEFKETNNALRKRNDELEVDHERCLEEKKELDAENKRLNNKLFHATSELEQMKKSSDSCDILKKDRLRSQQKCHVIAEKLEACKVKLEQSTNLLKEKSCLVDQQQKEIKDLNVTITDLKKVNSLSQIELEKNKNRIDDLESKLKGKEDLVNEYKTLYHEIKGCRENEIKHEQATIKALVMINSRYEIELAKVKSDLEKLCYDQLVRSKNKPDLIEDNAEHDRLNRLKKKYNILNGLEDEDEEVSDEAYEPVDETLNEYKASNGHNGYTVAKKEAFKINKFQNGNLTTSATAAIATGLNGGTPVVADCATLTILSESALPS